MEASPPPNKNAKPKVCRQLFPSEEPSNEDRKNLIEESLKKHLEEQKKKWNFDITNERMISDDGTYIWTKMEDGARYDWIGIPNNQAEDKPEEDRDNVNVMPQANDENRNEKNDTESNDLENDKEYDAKILVR